MEVRTTRFGVIDISEERIITFPRGLLGFPEHRRYCLLEPGEDACFFWLQSLEEPSLAFVITDPSLFIAEYSVPIRAEQMESLKLAKLEDAQVFVIVNKVDDQLTGNLQGPLVLNTLSREGEQLVLAEKRWTTRHPLVKVAQQDGAPSGATAGPDVVSGPGDRPATRAASAGRRSVRARSFGAPGPRRADRGGRPRDLVPPCHAARTSRARQARSDGLRRPAKECETMLVLSRQRDETIMIGDEIEITIVDIRGDKVRLGINAPTRIAVHRKEVYEAIRRENTDASRISGRDLGPIAAAISPGPAKSPPRPNRVRAAELASRPTPINTAPPGAPNARAPSARAESNGASAPPPAITRPDSAKAAGR